MSRASQRLFSALMGLGAVTLAACQAPPAVLPEDPAEVVIGERLFREPRFAQYAAGPMADDVNALWATGDPVLDELETLAAGRTSPFRGQAMSCRACHLVDDAATTDRLSVRAYADFARTSPIPDRGDGHTHTPRNSPTLVDTAPLADGPARFLHFDGQFPTPEDLVKGTFMGRNFGWLPSEGAQALAQLARVIREDNGDNALGKETWSLSYATLLRGTSPQIPAGFVLPESYRLDVAQASDAEIMTAVARLVGAYLRNLRFARDANGDYVGSPYDRFLILNQLPRRPAAGESPLAYARRLREALAGLTAPIFVEPGRLAFTHHDHPFVFGPSELRGLETFLREPTSEGAATAGQGSCVSCHAPPDFTDHGFHNTGVTQEGYDLIFGAGTFAALDIPSYEQRAANPAAFLPASGALLEGRGPFLAPTVAGTAGQLDLGLWNVFANPEFVAAQPAAQATLSELIAASAQKQGGTASELLPLSIALFKTPTLRDLGQSPPYFHDGSRDTLEDALQHYVSAPMALRENRLRNGAAELRGVVLGADDIADLAAFLRALDEDYE